MHSVYRIDLQIFDDENNNKPNIGTFAILNLSEHVEQREILCPATFDTAKGLIRKIDCNKTGIRSLRSFDLYVQFGLMLFIHQLWILLIIVQATERLRFNQNAT